MLLLISLVQKLGNFLSENKIYEIEPMTKMIEKKCISLFKHLINSYIINEY